MSQSSADRPGVITFPPIIGLAAIALAVILQWLVPLGAMQRIGPAWRTDIGMAIAIAGLLVACGGARTLVGRGTNVNPMLPSLALATAGIYRFTRNPMYVGGTALLIGLAFAFGLDWLPLLAIPAVLVLHFGVVRREERYLERKFGQAYLDYRARVPRYVWPI